MKETTNKKKIANEILSGVQHIPLELHKIKEFRKSFQQKIFYIGLSAIPLGLLILGVITTFVYEKVTKDYNVRKRLEYYNKRMKWGTE